MKKRVLFLFGIIFTAIILLIFASNLHTNNVNYADKLSGKKAVIVYYSYSNNTKNVANMIKRRLNCDIKEITSEEYKNLSLEDLNNLVNEQMQKNYIPKTTKIDIADYNIVFVGSPVWKNSLSLPVKSFLVNNDFNNKIIVPFYTFGGITNKSNLDDEIKDFSRNNNVLPSFLTVYSKFAFVEYRLDKWLNKIISN